MMFNGSCAGIFELSVKYEKSVEWSVMIMKYGTKIWSTGFGRVEKWRVLYWNYQLKAFVVIVSICLKKNSSAKNKILSDMLNSWSVASYMHIK